MTCGVEPVSLKFLGSGIEIRPYEISTRTPRKDYSHARLKVSHEAAMLIEERALNDEPVEVYLNDTFHNRYIYPAETLEINRKDGHLKLYDARKILDNGVMSGYHDEVQVYEIMDLILDARKDPYSVLTGWDATSEQVETAEKQTVTEDIGEAIYGNDYENPRNWWERPVSDAVGMVVNKATWFSPDMEPNRYEGLDLDDVSPNQALQTLEQTFGFTSWVDRDGTLWIGHPAVENATYHAVSGHPRDNRYALSQYNIVRTDNPITMVRVNGKTKWFRGDLENDPGNPGDELFPVAEAWIVGADGDVAEGHILVMEDHFDVWDLETLEAIARRHLAEKNADYRSGSMVLNASASTEQAALVGMNPGDVVVVSDVIEECSGHQSGGAFLIEEVQQSLSTRRGWRTTVEVSVIPPKVDATSLYYDATDDEAYSDLRSYRLNNGDPNYP